MIKIFLLFLSYIAITFSCFAQVSGDLMLNANFFQRDSSIGAANNSLYDNYLSGGENWLSLNYSTLGFDFRIRYDAFTNSNLHNPTQAYSDHGIGFWSVKKDIENLSITGGYIYDQFGSGLVFRSYEDRGLGIDNAIKGIHLKYQFNENWMIKAFAGQQKNKFSSFRPIIKGINTERYFNISDNLKINPGASFVNRTIDQTSMNILVSNINSLPLSERFYPKYNVYVYSFYNTAYLKNFSWYIEVAQKTQEAVKDYYSKLLLKPGHVYYTNLAYSKKGFGATIQYKETEYFPFRTSPNEVLLDGIINYLPPLTKLNTYRLPARYPASAQEWGEKGIQADIVLTPKKGHTFSANYSYITDLEDTLLYNEINAEYEIKINKNLHAALGTQIIKYNQARYQFKPGYPMVDALTPFMEILYKVKKNQSLRIEFQYMRTKQDYGSWAYGLLEYNIAPKWSIAIIDMYNIEPNPKVTKEKNHYYTMFISLTKGANRFTLSYVKQVEGVVCTGGVCRLEPAFSGIKFTVNSSF